MLKGISFFTAPMFARLLSTNEYGKLTLFASYEQIILIFATWEVGLSPTQRGLIKFKSSKQVYRSSIILFSMVTSAIVFFIMMIFRNAITNFTEIPIWLLICMSIYTFFYTAYMSWMTENKLYYNYRIVSLTTVGMTVVQIVSALLAVNYIRATADIKMFFTIIPIIVVSFVVCMLRFKPSILIHNKEQTKVQLHFILMFAGPLVLHSLSFLVLGQADRVMIGKMVGNSEAGLYSVAYTIASVVIIVQNAVLQVLSPWIYQKMDEKEYGQIKEKMKIIMLLVCAIYVVFILIAPDVIILMYPKYYWEGIWCIPPISMGVFFMFMYSLFVAIEECMDQTKYVAIVSITCAIINVILNFIGIKLFGYIACAYTTLFCYVLFAVGHYYSMTKILKQKLNDIKVYDGKMFFILSIFMLSFMIGISFIYNNRILRYLLAMIIPFGCVLFKDKIVVMLKELKIKK